MLLYSVTGKRVKGMFMFFIFRYSCLIIQDEGEEEGKKMECKANIKVWNHKLNSLKLLLTPVFK